MVNKETLTQPPVVKHYFTCLPYLNLGRMPEIDLGFAKIWNFDLQKEKYITNQALRAHVETILKSYRGSYPYGEGLDGYPPLYGMGFISTGEPTDKEPTEEENEKIKDARLILFISFMAKRNTWTRNVNSGHSMGSSENFSAIHFSAVIGSEIFTDQVGFVLPSWHGLEIKKNLVIRSRHVPTPQFDSYGIDGDLLNALIKLRLKHKRAFRRLISAVEVFFESYYNAYEVSHNARILLQTSAFEILLHAHTGGGREKLKALLKRVSTYPHDKKVRFRSERGKGTVWETGTMREKWADHFFTLRNHITHGYVPKPSEYLFGKWQRHFDIAFFFFIFCLKWTVGEAFRKEIFFDDVVWKTWVDDLQLPPKIYTGFEYNTYGYRAWERECQNERSRRNT